MEQYMNFLLDLVFEVLSGSLINFFTTLFGLLTGISTA